MKPHQHPASATLLHSPTLPHKHTSFCHTLALTNTSSQAHQHLPHSCHTSFCHTPALTNTSSQPELLVLTLLPHQHLPLLPSLTLPHNQSCWCSHSCHTSFCHTPALTNPSSQPELLVLTLQPHQLYSCHTSICHSCTHQHFFTTRAAGAHQPHQSHQLKHFHTTKS